MKEETASADGGRWLTGSHGRAATADYRSSLPTYLGGG